MSTDGKTWIVLYTIDRALVNTELAVVVCLEYMKDFLFNDAILGIYDQIVQTTPR